MVDNLRKQLETIRNLSSQFNTLSNEINKTVEAVEQFLNVTCSVGIPAFVLVEQDDPISTYLEYRRVGSKFRIAVVDAGPQFPNESVKPWADCARDVKTETFKKLPDLLAKISEELQTRIKEAQSTILAIKPIIGEIQAGEIPSSTTESNGEDIPF